jgi:hypothetical protein
VGRVHDMPMEILLPILPSLLLFLELSAKLTADVLGSNLNEKLERDINFRKDCRMILRYYI